MAHLMLFYCGLQKASFLIYSRTLPSVSLSSLLFLVLLSLSIQHVYLQTQVIKMGICMETFM